MTRDTGPEGRTSSPAPTADVAVLAGGHGGSHIGTGAGAHSDAGVGGDAAGDVELHDEDSPFEQEPRDWAWVEEWRETREPMPWGPGLAIAFFTGFLVASAVYVLCSGLSSRPLVAIGVNVVVVAGLCPALWLSRGLPVLRWIAGGAAAGVLAAWLCVLVFLI